MDKCTGWEKGCLKNFHRLFLARPEKTWTNGHGPETDMWAGERVEALMKRAPQSFTEVLEFFQVFENGQTYRLGKGLPQKILQVPFGQARKNL